MADGDVVLIRDRPQACLPAAGSVEGIREERRDPEAWQDWRAARPEWGLALSKSE